MHASYTYTYTYTYNIYIYIYIYIVAFIHPYIHPCHKPKSARGAPRHPEVPASSLKLKVLNRQSCMHTYIHTRTDTHTHTHIYIDRHMYVYIYVGV